MGLFIFRRSVLNTVGFRSLNTKQKKVQIILDLDFISDSGRIQTSNLLSRNQVLYSVKLRSLLAGANITIYCF